MSRKPSKWFRENLSNVETPQPPEDYLPNTDELRGQLQIDLRDAIKDEENVVFDPPTSLGKTHTVATTPWNQVTTSNQEVAMVHLHQTRSARDEAAERSKKEGLNSVVIKGREDLCPLAKGDYDDEIKLQGQSVSEWIDRRCNRNGLPFRVVHNLISEHVDGELPCEADHGVCPSSAQWDRIQNSGSAPIDIVHATHPFAFVPALRVDTNIVFDERPDFTVTLESSTPGPTQDDIRRAITAFLDEIDAPAPLSTFENLVTFSQDPGILPDSKLAEIEAALQTGPETKWFIRNPNAHVHAEGIARAIFEADEVSNERRAGTVTHSLPNFGEAGHSSDDVQISIVIDAKNNIHTLRIRPDLRKAQSVIGLDAFPVVPLWELNTGLELERRSIIGAASRRQWRYSVRGLRVIQVGSDDNYHTRASNFNEKKTRALIRRLRDEHGDDFRACICSKAVESRVEAIMEDEGIADPLLMHYGEQKSRNDFADESVGLVIGCIDQGDEPILDVMAELGLDASPEREDTECSACDGAGCSQCDQTGYRRASGRGFVGQAAGTAAKILADVRDYNVAQAVGRFARDPDDPDDYATVYVQSTVLPSATLIDERVPGVIKKFTQKQTDIIGYARTQSATTAEEVARNTNASRRHAADTLEELVDHGFATVDRGGQDGKYRYEVDSETPLLAITGL